MTDKLDALKRQVAALETGGDPAAAAVLPTGVAALDAELPGGGLACNAVHELLFPDAADSAATGFLVHLLTRLGEGSVLWASCRDDLYAPGLTARGFDAGRLLLVRCPDMNAVLWALEEGLRAKGLAAVVGEVGDIDFALSRRLQLAAAEAGLPLFLLRPWRHKLAASAAATRWLVRAALPWEARDIEGELERNETETIERVQWHAELLRCRGGRPQDWDLEKSDETNRLAVAAAPDHGPDRTRAA